MSFRTKKLRAVFWILGIGMIAAWIFHGWEAWVAKAPYPYNTFLFNPNDRFHDFTGLVELSCLPSPYLALGNYPPTIYMVLRLFGGWPSWLAGGLFIGLPTLLLAVLLGLSLRPLIRSTGWLVLAVIAFFAWSFPIIFCLDRANIEIVMVCLIALGLICFKNRRYNLGLACLVPAICFKVYPVLLTALLIRKHQTHRVLIAGVLVAAITFGSFLTFSTTMTESLTLSQESLDRYTNGYIIFNNGLAGTASLWNMMKASIYSVIYFIATAHHQQIHIEVGTLQTAYAIYRFAFGLLTILITLFVMFVERKFFRRAIPLLLLMAMSAPTGADYRLLYVTLATVILVLLPLRRRHDFVAVCLLAFATIPKREFLLTWLGSTDSGWPDISIGVILNPICILTAMTLLLRDGFRQGSMAHVRQRFIGIFQPFLAFAAATVSTRRPSTRPAAPPSRRR
jgi:hypothetical protein